MIFPNLLSTITIPEVTLAQLAPAVAETPAIRPAVLVEIRPPNPQLTLVELRAIDEMKFY